MNRFEKNILKGLYLVEPRPRHSKTFDYVALHWLHGKYPWQVKHWFTIENFQPHFKEVDPMSLTGRYSTSKRCVQPALDYLRDEGFIRIISQDSFRVQVVLTDEGYDRVRPRHGWTDKIEHFFKLHRRSAIWTAVAAAILLLAQPLATHLVNQFLK